LARRENGEQKKVVQELTAAQPLGGNVEKTDASSVRTGPTAGPRGQRMVDTLDIE